jgi:hypothetical protein
MKKIVYILFAFLLTAIMYSCKEEFVGQTPTNSVAPGKVINPQWVSLPGGAKITYDLPTDDDLLYVKAVYTLNGKEKNTSASLHNKTLEVQGFGTTDPQVIQLYCVDRSENYSEPVSIEIVPGTPPVRTIFESLTMEAAFGGIQLIWQNINKADIAIYVQVKGDDGEWNEVDVVYTNVADGKYNVRGMDAVEKEFNVYIRDRWDNVSDSKTEKFTPIPEEKLDKTKWTRKILLGDNDTESAFGPWSKIKNDIWETDDIWETSVGKTPILFTVDLGTTTKLSRYALWHRGHGDWEYIHHNPKYWTVWGTDVLSTTNDAAYWTATEGGWKNDWIQLADCVSLKPSGMDTPVTQEDRNYANQGFQFDMPLNAPPVRYIRFHVTATWDNGDMLHVSELTFWGMPSEE